MKKTKIDHYTDKEALDFHNTNKSGKIEIISSKPMTTKRDLALASKPVMEGKAILFKRFADIDSIDLEIDSSNADEIVNCITSLSKSFGGINLEDIAAPDCFIIEQKLREKLDIPIFHDDQHGTAIITLAALINALDISGKSLKDIKVVVNGAGASAIACTNLFKSLSLIHI